MNVGPAGYLIAAVVGAVSAAGLVTYIFKRQTVADSPDKQLAKLSGQLKTNKLQSEILINSIGDGIILISTDGKISLMNPAAAAMTEWAVKDAMGIDAATVVKLAKEDGEDLAANDNPIKQVLGDRKPINDVVLQLKGRAQKILTVSLVISPVINPKNQEFIGAVAVLRDISSARAEERRRADFVSTASHEMRTPVAAIEGYLALALNDKVSQIDAKARDYLMKAHSSTQHLGQLFQDLLTSSKAEDGRLVSHPGVVEMAAFMEQLTDSLKFAAEKKGLLVDFVIGADIASGTNPASTGKVIRPLYYVYADPDRMQEVVTNLFDNAVKYTEKGKISLGLTGNADVVQLYIKDSGIGIPPEDIPHMFQKFYRVDNSVTRTIGGTGLGLFICRKIVELYQGRIWVESTPGQGSTFYINLPRLSSQRAAELQKAPPLVTAAPPALTPVTTVPPDHATIGA